MGGRGGGVGGEKGEGRGAAVDEKKKTTQAVKHDTRNMLYWSYYIEKEQARKWGRKKKLANYIFIKWWGRGGGSLRGIFLKKILTK